MSSIFPDSNEIDELVESLCFKYSNAAIQLIRIVEKNTINFEGMDSRGQMDRVRRAVMYRMPDVFAGSSEGERELRRLLIYNLPEHKRIHLERDFLRRRIWGNLHEKRWDSGGKFACRLMAELDIPKVFAGAVNKEKKQKFEDMPPKPIQRKLVDYQKEMKKALLSTLNGDDVLIRCMISLPTGAGKTRVAVEALIEWMLPRFSEEKYLLWITQSVELCEQVIDSIRYVWSTREYVVPLRVYRYFAGNKFDLDELHGGVIISSINQLHERRYDFIYKYVVANLGAVIIDEAHRAQARMYQTFMVRCKEIRGNTNIPVCGLSATPGQIGYNAKEKFRRMKGLFFSNLITPTIPKHYAGREIEYFRDQGYLARPIFYRVKSGRRFILTDKQKQTMDGFGYEFPPDFNETVGSDNPRNQKILELLCRLKETSKSVLVYACSVGQAHEIAADLNKDEFVSYSIDSNTPRHIRSEAITLFKEREIQFLINYSVLTTGFDAPLTEYIVICRPIRSVILYEQIIGRGLRGVRFNGTPECRIIDIEDTIDRYGDQMAYARFSRFWHDVDQSDIGEKREMNAVTNRVLPHEIESMVEPKKSENEETLTIQTKLSTGEEHTDKSVVAEVKYDERFNISIPELTETERACLKILVNKYGAYHEIYLSPFLRKLSDALPNHAHWERKGLLKNLELKGALRMEKRSGIPFDYTVVILNYNHPVVREMC